MGARFTLKQFSEIFRIRNPAGKLYVLIGGQAVNYWAERYLAVEPGLKKHVPFTSLDIDFRGTRDDVSHIAGLLKLAPVFPPKVAMTALAGAIQLRLDNEETSIEIVRSIPGITTSMADALAIEMAWNGKTIRVLDPVSLFICKVELALTVAQEKRQDVGHLKILLFCVRGFLRELLREVENQRVSAKAWLGTANRLFKLSKSTHGRQAARKFQIDWTELLPLPDIANAKNEQIISFREMQMTRGFG